MENFHVCSTRLELTAQNELPSLSYARNRFAFCHLLFIESSFPKPRFILLQDWKDTSSNLKLSGARISGRESFWVLRFSFNHFENINFHFENLPISISLKWISFRNLNSVRKTKIFPKIHWLEEVSAGLNRMLFYSEKSFGLPVFIFISGFQWSETLSENKHLLSLKSQ